MFKPSPNWPKDKLTNKKASLGENDILSFAFPVELLDPVVVMVEEAKKKKQATTEDAPMNTTFLDG